MNLGFKLYLDDEKTQPTHFPEKVLASLFENSMLTEIEYNHWLKAYKWNDQLYPYKDDVKAKDHTIRDDESDSWKGGKLIHAAVGIRQPWYYRFAPVFPCLGTQEVFMTYAHNDLIEISIDDHELFGYSERLEFAQRDGFDTWQQFFDWWYPIIMKSEDEAYSGKLIHWTNKRY